MEPRLHPLLGLDVFEKVLARLFAQKTEDRSVPREREMQGSKVGPLLKSKQES